LKCYACKIVAEFESWSLNFSNTFWYGNAGKAGTKIKSRHPDGRNTVSYGYAGKVFTPVKSSTPNVSNTVGYDNACNAALTKRVWKNFSNAIWNGKSAFFPWWIRN
jgi:hypothetical protein